MDTHLAPLPRARTLLITAWPWRSLAYLLGGAVFGALLLLALMTALAVGVVSAPIGVGLVVLAAVGLAGLPVARLERWRLRLLDSREVSGPHPVVAEPGLWPWLRAHFRNPFTWRALAGTVVIALVIWPVELLVLLGCVAAPLDLLSAPVRLALWESDGDVQLLKVVSVDSPWVAMGACVVGACWLATGAYAVTATALCRAAVTRWWLRRGAGTPSVVELTRSRARLVEAFETERRRIERDLHDGAQQRLVAVSMTLGMAELAEGDEVRRLVRQAHEHARAALAELRELIFGIHPRVLTDRGLPAALTELADRCPVPVTTAVRVPERLPAAIEAAAYFAVAEALSNLARHSGATAGQLRASVDDDWLVVEVRDDGVGGADPTRGTGLAGLADRIGVVDGTLRVSSPVGGPTVLRMRIPCRP